MSKEFVSSCPQVGQEQAQPEKEKHHHFIMVPYVLLDDISYKEGETDIELSPHHLKAFLRFLRKCGGHFTGSLCALARKLGMAKATVMRAIDAWVKCNLVTKEGNVQIDVCDLWQMNYASYPAKEEASNISPTVSQRNTSISQRNTTVSGRNTAVSQGNSRALDEAAPDVPSEAFSDPPIDSLTRDTLEDRDIYVLRSYIMGYGGFPFPGTHNTETVSHIVNMTTGNPYTAEEQSLDFSNDGKTEEMRELSELGREQASDEEEENTPAGARPSILTGYAEMMLERLRLQKLDEQDEAELAAMEREEFERNIVDADPPVEQMSTEGVEKQESTVDNVEQASGEKDVTQESEETHGGRIMVHSTVASRDLGSSSRDSTLPQEQAPLEASRKNTDVWQDEGTKPASEETRTVASEDAEPPSVLTIPVHRAAKSAEMIAEEVKAQFAAPPMATVPPLPARPSVASVVKKSQGEEVPTPLECPDLSGPLSKETILAYFDYQRGYRLPVLFSPKGGKRKTPYEASLDCAYSLWQLCLSKRYGWREIDAVYRFMRGLDKDTGVYDAYWDGKAVDIGHVLQYMDCKLREIERKHTEAKTPAYHLSSFDDPNYRMEDEFYPMQSVQKEVTYATR